MSFAVQNCGWKLKFQCPRSWDGLQPTEDPDIRMCGACAEQVFRCYSDSEAQLHAKQGHCVAVFIPDATNSDIDELLGEVCEE